MTGIDNVYGSEFADVIKGNGFGDVSFTVSAATT